MTIKIYFNFRMLHNRDLVDLKSLVFMMFKLSSYASIFIASIREFCEILMSLHDWTNDYFMGIVRIRVD